MKYQKLTVEEQFLDLIAKYHDKKMAFLLIFYFLMINWSTVSEIKSTAYRLETHSAFLNINTNEIFGDRCNIISRGSDLLF